MHRGSVIVAALIAAALVGCDSSTSPAPSESNAALAQASSSAGAVSSGSAAPSALPSPSPSPSPTPSPSASVTASPTATPTPTATPSPTPAPTPTPWKRFTSKRYRYRISYPPTWIPTPGGAGVSDQFDGFGYPFVYLFRDTVSGIVSVSLTVSHDTAYYKTHYHAKLLSNQGITLASGYRGRMLTFKGTDNGLPVIIRHIIVAKGSVAYFLDEYGTVPTSKADLAIFKKMYLSWRPT